MRSNWYYSTFIAVALFVLTACGGGGGDSGPTLGSPEVEQKGQFIDSPVSGMTYVASPSGRTGTTDASGTYSYEAGDTIEFFIGGISIGSAPAAPIMTPITVVASVVSGSVDATHIVVINIARFLQSIDEDGNLGNGIQIPAAIATAAASKTLDFFSVTFDADATTVLADLASSAGIAAITGDLIGPVAALDHFSDSILLCEHTGSYSGTWVQTAGTEADNGIWTMSASTTGSVSGSGTSSVFDESFDLAGSVSADGTTTAGSTTTGAVFNGVVSSDGTLSGTWTNSTFATSGTFTGSRSGSATSCPSSIPGTGGDTGVAADMGSFTIVGDDVSSGLVANTFTPLWEAAVTLSPSTSIHVTWTDFNTSAPSTTIGSLTHQLELQFDSATGEISSLTFRATHLGERSLFYFLDCSSGSCAGLGVTANALTKEVMFSNADLSVSGIFGDANAATAPITLNGTLIYDVDSTSGTPGGDTGTPGDGSGGSGEDTSVFAGTYEGTFSGEYSGTWIFNIDASGSLTGNVDPDPVDRPTFALDVSVSSTGVISGGGMTGTVSTDGTISGTWSGDISGGTFSGSLVAG